MNTPATVAILFAVGFLALGESHAGLCAGGLDHRDALAIALLEEGQSVLEVAQALEVLPNSLHKAIRSGRLQPTYLAFHRDAVLLRAVR